jgi:hypothetical protein
MTDCRTESSSRDIAGGFNRTQAFRSTAFSLTINALCPYLLYRFLEPRFPDESVLPLLYSSIFPVIGFLVGVLRKRMIDLIAAIVLFGIVFHITVTVLSPNVSTALVVRSFQGTIIGACFLISTAIDRPIVLYVARQLVTAGAPERRAIFNAVVAADKGRTFRVTTTVWGCGLALMSASQIVLTTYLAHVQFVLISPTIGVGTDLLLLAWSIHYTTRRLSPLIGTVPPTC